MMSGDIQQAGEPLMPDYITLDTLGRLYEHGHSLFGYCLRCRSSFDIDMVALIAERGPNSQVVGMVPIPCPRCGSTKTERRITGPWKGR